MTHIIIIIIIIIIIYLIILEYEIDIHQFWSCKNWKLWTSTDLPFYVLVPKPKPFFHPHVMHLLGLKDFSPPKILYLPLLI